MTYYKEFKSLLRDHIDSLEKYVSNFRMSSDKVRKHIELSNRTYNAFDTEDPVKLRIFVEYIASEARGFGWSFPENEFERLCENSFWEMHSKVRILIDKMTLSERLSYFGYSEEFEKIPEKHKSDRDRILHKIFVYNDTALNRRSKKLPGFV